MSYKCSYNNSTFPYNQPQKKSTKKSENSSFIVDNTVDNVQKNNPPVYNVFSNILESIKQKRVIDIERGFTSIGAHRDDYKFEINGDPLENFGSQGQIKTVILSLKLAQKEIIEEKLNEKPIMLLDDVMSELDKNRREYILTKIQDCQIIITCTDIEDIKLEENTKIYLIKKA